MWHYQFLTVRKALILKVHRKILHFSTLAAVTDDCSSCGKAQTLLQIYGISRASNCYQRNIVWPTFDWLLIWEWPTSTCKYYTVSESKTKSTTNNHQYPNTSLKGINYFAQIITSNLVTSWHKSFSQCWHQIVTMVHNAYYNHQIKVND